MLQVYSGVPVFPSPNSIYTHTADLQSCCGSQAYQVSPAVPNFSSILIVYVVQWWSNTATNVFCIEQCGLKIVCQSAYYSLFII